MVRTMLALLGLLAAIVLGAPAPAAGNTEGSITFGSQWWTQTAPEAKYQEFGQAPRGAFLDSYAIRDWRDRNLIEFYGSNALRKDQAASLTWWNGARVRVDVDYRQIPHNISFTSQTPYTQIGLGTLVLPDSLQRANELNPSAYASRMTDLLNAAPRVALGFRTDIARARVRARPARGWQLELTGVRREREGTKPYGGSFGFNSAVEIFEPISQRTIDADARASYQKTFASGSALSVEAKAGLSAFDNDVDALRWDNPKRLTDRTYASAYVAGDGTSLGQLDLYPDNRSVHGDLAVGLQLPRRTAFSAAVGIRQDTQDDRWLPYTVNTAILQPDTFPLPGTNTEAKAIILSQNYRFTTNAVKSFGATLRYRQYHYDNQTSEHDFPGHVRLDQVWEAIPASAEPRGYKQRVYGVDLDWNPVARTTLAGTYEVQKRDRDHREIESDEEKSWSIQARVRPMTGVEAKARYRRGDRKQDKFLEEDYQDSSGNFIEQPTLRRFDVANRIQQMADGSLSWSPNEKFVLMGTVAYQFNDFRDSPLGLRNERQQNASAEATYHATDRLDFNAGYGWGQVETDQHSRESGGVLVMADSTSWRARLRDWNIYAFGGFDLWITPDKISLSSSYEFQRSPGIYRLTNFKGTAKDLPGTRYRRQDVRLDLGYKIDEGMEIMGRYAWEQWDVTDFASEDVPLLFPVTGATNAIFLGDSVLDYRANKIALVIKRSF